MVQAVNLGAVRPSLPIPEFRLGICGMEQDSHGEAHVNFIEDLYRRNFRLRVEDPAHFTTAQKETVHEPILMFFTDEFSSLDAI